MFTNAISTMLFQESERIISWPERVTLQGKRLLNVYMRLTEGFTRSQPL